MKRIYLLFSLLLIIFINPINLFTSNKTKKIIIGRKDVGNFSFPVKSINQQELIYNCFSRIVSLDSNNSIISDLAERWNIYKNHTKYVFYIRDNIYFHDNTKLEVKDIKKSLEYEIKHFINYFSPEIREIKGVDEYLNGKTNHIKGITTDRNRIEITLKKPVSNFLFYLSDLNLSIFKIKNGKPFGTGGYELIKLFKKGEKTNSMVFKKYKRYFFKIEKAPDIVEIIVSDNFKPIKKYDIVRFNEINSIKKDYLESFNLYKIQTNTIHFISFNLRSYWGKNKNFRKFIIYSFDFRKFLKRYKLSQFAQPNLIPIGYSFYRDIHPFPNYNKKLGDYYLSKIKNKQKPVVLLSTDRFYRKEFMESIRNLLIKKRFKVNFKNQPYNVFIKNLLAVAYKNKNDMDILPLGKTLTSPPFSVSHYLYSVFYPRAENNAENYGNKKIIGLLNRLKTVLSKRKRLEIINSMIDIYNEDVPSRPLYTGIDYYLINKKIKKFLIHPLMYIDYRDIQLE
jgi:peptide/nickel transport system substrate-binding protein